MTSLPAARLRRQEPLVAAGGVGVLATAWVLPGLWARGVQPIPQCIFHQLTGQPCPMCGATRSFAAMAHGNIGGAVHVYPLGPLMFAALVVAVLYSIAVLLTGRRVQVLMDDRLYRGLVLLAGAMLLVNWMAKIFILGY
ncbi:MAG: DUF2752 domain-containing protein [Candidatus Dormibacteria bacterium]